jgi:signal transduction histidine kinase/ligand-binding sensor domain-containing protein
LDQLVLRLHSDRKLFLIFILCFAGTLATGQVTDPSNLLFRYITIEDGLPNNKVNAIAMDKNGFMWFGTNDGICRYDGLSIKPYPIDHLIGNQARTSQISVIRADSRSNLFIGTYAFFRYDYTKDQIVRCDSLSSDELTGRVYAIDEGQDGIIWLGCEKGLFSYNIETDSITYHRLRDGKDFTIISLMADNNNLWVGTRSDGILTFEIKTGIYSSIPDFKLSGAVKDQVNCFFKDSQKRIWAGTQDNGIFVYSPADTSLIHFYPDSSNTLSYRVRKIINDKYGNIWIGCRLGIFFKKVNSERMVLIRQVDPLPSTTRSNSIYDIFIDHNEIMWTGTFSFGVSYTDFRRKPFRLYNLSDEETMFFAKMINCFTDCDERNIWIGTEEGGLFLFNRNTRKFKQFKPEPGNRNSLSGVNVKVLARKKNGNLWIGYYNSGLDFLDVKSEKITHFINDRRSPTSISSNLIRSMTLDDQENLWIGTDKGIDLIMDGSREFKHYRLNLEVLILYKDKWNNIWAGTSGSGIYKYNKSSDSFEKIYPEYFTTSIKAIYLDSKDNLWVGTNKGLYHVDQRNDSMTYTGIDQGLPSNAILDILEDNDQNLWVSTGAGLVKCQKSVANPESFNVLKFGSQDGLQGENFREYASYKNIAGEFYFGGVQGFNIFFPDSIRVNPYPPKVAFTQLKIFNRNVAIGQFINGRMVLERALNETSHLTLSYKHSPLSIEFAALHFSNPKNNQFRYKLEPLEKEWNTTSGMRNFASYSNLKGGDYKLIIEAANADGLWNPESRILEIEVIPPVWRTWWFSAILIFILTASAVGYYFYRISLLKRYNTELERKVLDRTQKLSETLGQVIEKQKYIEEQAEILNQQKEQLLKLNSTKDRLFSIVAHDLRSPFQSLLSLSEMLYEEIKTSNNPDLLFYARSINESSGSLYELVENLLNWSRIQKDHILFEPVKIDIQVIIEKSIELLHNNADQKRITIDKHFGTQKEGFGDKNMIELVLRNLIANAIKFTPENGRIQIFLDESDNLLRIAVSDNGIGISAEDQLKLFKIDSNFSLRGTNGEKGSGLGLIVCREFIQKNNGNIWLESKPGEGSTFYFTLPKYEEKTLL